MKDSPAMSLPGYNITWTEHLLLEARIIHPDLTTKGRNWIT
jgi:hypothetical protein